MPNAKGGRGKRRYPKKHGSQPNNHLRGRPGVLLTCEHGREVKCQREGMEILQYYINRSKSTKSDQKVEVDTSQSDPKKTAQLDLDQELENLRKQSKQRPTRQQHPDLTVHDTGCNGMVLVLCTLPDCHVVPVFDSTVAKPDIKGDAAASAAGDGDTLSKHGLPQRSDSTDESKASQEPAYKKAKTEPNSERILQGKLNETKDGVGGSGDAPRDKKFVLNEKEWDPVPVVRSILLEASQKSNMEAPSSRFVSRLIPLQATCFASMKEIVATAKVLLQRLLHQMETEATAKSINDNDTATHPTTFSIHAKRRYCDHLTTQSLIETLGAQVVAPLAPTWKVDLTNPTVKIWVEVCRTSAGVSIFRVGDLSKIQANFNMAELLLASTST